MKSLTIQMVTWNSARELRENLDVLKKLPTEWKFKVIDNNSRDDSVKLIRSNLKNTEVIELTENIGFGRGHNIGFKTCDTDLVMLYNPDLKADWNGIRKCLTEFEVETVGAAQGLLMRDQEIIDSAGVVLARSLNGIERGAGKKVSSEYLQKEEILAATGAAAIYRLDAVRQVGGYDDMFFAYKGDVDLGWRLRRAGWKTLYVPVVVGFHPRAIKSKNIWARRKDKRTHWSLRNWLWMMTKNASGRQLFLNWPWILGRVLIWLGVTSLYWPLFTAWKEGLTGLPKMLKRRRLGSEQL